MNYDIIPEIKESFKKVLKSIVSQKLGYWNAYFLIKLILIHIMLYTPSLRWNSILIVLIVTNLNSSQKSKINHTYFLIPLIALAAWIVKIELSYYHPFRLALLWQMYSPNYLIQEMKTIAHSVPFYRSLFVVVFLISTILIAAYLVDLTALTLLLMAVTMGMFLRQSQHAENFYQNFLSDQKKIVLPHSLPADSEKIAAKIILIQVCSLSVDDLETTQLKDHPFWNQFDYVSWNFNSGASYSDLAAYRLMRSLCGQTSMDTLREVAPQNDPCSAAEYLANEGFSLASLYDHNGRLYDYAKKNQEVAKLPLPSGQRIRGKPFARAQIYPTHFVYEEALQTLVENPRKFIFLNFMLLHRGMFGKGEKINSVDAYIRRVENLFDKTTQFIKKLESHTEPILIVFVGEHGYPLRTTWPQLHGVRDIPTPTVTVVPFAVKYIGNHSHHEKMAQSYIPITNLDLGKLLIEFVDNPKSFNQPHQLWKNKLLDADPTAFVSESYWWILIRMNNHIYLRNRHGALWWKLARL